MYILQKECGAAGRALIYGLCPDFVYFIKGTAILQNGVKMTSTYTSKDRKT